MNNNSYTRGSGLLEGFLTKQRAKKAESFIPENFRKGRILDIGCGYVPFFLTSTRFKEKYGMDPSLNATLIKQNSLKLYKAEISDKRLFFKDEFFDIVTMLAVFEHIEYEKLIKVLEEIRRILKR